MDTALVMEMQKDAIHEGSPLDIGKMARATVPNVQRLIAIARERKVPVIYANLCCIPGDPLFQKYPRAHCLPGTTGIEVIDELKPEVGDYVMHIYAMNAFLHTGLEHILRALGVTTLIISGTTTDVSCLLTAMEAFQRGFEVILVTDCCASWTQEKHQMGLNYLKPFKKFIQQLTLDDIVVRFKGER